MVTALLQESNVDLKTSHAIINTVLEPRTVNCCRGVQEGYVVGYA